MDYKNFSNKELSLLLNSEVPDLGLLEVSDANRASIIEFLRFLTKTDKGPPSRLSKEESRRAGKLAVL